MTAGELWVTHPLFPWLMFILALWVVFSTAATARNWARILKLQRHNKLLQEMMVEGIGGLAKRLKDIEENDSAKSEPAPTEEVRAGGDDILRNEEDQRTESGSSEAAYQAG